VAVQSPPNDRPAGSRRLLLLSVVLLISLVCATWHSPRVAAQEGERCFPDAPGIDNCVAGRFGEFWAQHGGLDVFGYPLTPAEFVSTAEGAFLTQYFERARFELHPENLPPYDVLLGRLGDERYSELGGNWQDEGGEDPIPACDFWSETLHNVCGPFAETWRGNGLNIDDDPAISTAESLALWGLPLTDANPITTDNGVAIVQWFERARFEQQPDGSITIGRLGAEALDTTPVQEPAPAPETPEAPAAPPAPTDTPPPAVPAAPPVPNVTQPGVPCNTNVPVPAEGIQVWMADPTPVEDAVACVRLILNGEAVNGAPAMAYRYYGSERRPSIPQSTGRDGVASFIFYTGQDGGRVPVEAVVTYRGQTYVAYTEYTPE
jgi:hypothetical protein